MGKWGIFDCLTCIFVTLKLTDLITWSWWIVLTPFLIGFALDMLSAFLDRKVKKLEKEVEILEKVKSMRRG